MLSRINLVLVMTASSVLLAACASSSAPSGWSATQSKGAYKVGKSYTINGKTYYPEEVYAGTQEGMASWYGPGFHGKRTANGEVFDENALTAAHPTLQMPSLVRVTNLQNNRSVVVRVNDRGPFHSNRVMDLSKAGAEALGFRNMGTARVRLDILTNESMALAEAAKRKIDTRGAEIAMNTTGQLDARFTSFYPTMVAKPADATMLAMAGSNPVISGTGYQPQVAAATALEVAPLGVPSSVQYQTIDQAAPIMDTDPNTVVAQRAPAVAEAVLPPLNTGAVVPASKPIPAQMPVERIAVQQQAYQMAPVMDAPIPPEAPRGILGRISIGTKSANAAEVAPVADASHYVQVGAFLSKASAQILRDDLAHFGPAAIVPARPGDQVYFRVRLGPYQTAGQADDVVDSLKSQGRMAMVVEP